MKKGMRYALEKKYENIVSKYGLEHPFDGRKISTIIRKSLRDFLRTAQKPAIYCNGGHTQMLMADFMFDMKKVQYIIDNYSSTEKEGFLIIRDEDIEREKIDAIIISSFKFRNTIKEGLKKKHSHIPVLDIYDELERNGLSLQSDYYYSNHPYHYYRTINKLQRELAQPLTVEKKVFLYEQLVTKYIQIYDFRTALLKIKEIQSIVFSERMQELYRDIEELYQMELEAAAIHQNNVLMLCLDGLRFQDLSEQTMPKVKKILDDTAYCFTNAYSFSTSTFESLVPVYSENGDLRTHYYEKNTVDEKECRFIRLANEQKRNIYIYGDQNHYIEGENILYSEKFQTATEKIWNFILDGCEEENGLFYIHELYESHFTFSNPYTTEPLKSEGTVMLYDFLPARGGSLRADYKLQHQDAVRYLDDILEPFLKQIECRMVLYADHGNLILDKDADLSEISDIELSCSQGWTRIPLVIRSPEIGVGINNNLMSLMELTSIIVSLLNRENYMELFNSSNTFIKLARSELYNPNYRCLYQLLQKEQYLQAFECFVFDNGYKLLVFENGHTELYMVNDDLLVQNDEMKCSLFKEIEKQITVLG